MNDDAESAISKGDIALIIFKEDHASFIKVIESDVNIDKKGISLKELPILLVFGFYLLEDHYSSRD